MLHKEKNVSASGIIILVLVMINVIILKVAFIQNENWYWALTVTLPLLLIAVLDVRQTKYAILRNYPVIGRLRYFFESIRPELGRCFFERDLLNKKRQAHS
jgi:hypothetical protein